MSDHEEFLCLLVARDELVPAERAALNAHLAACEPCRQTAYAYVRARTRLRALSEMAPPRDLRRRVLDAADRTYETFSLWAPFAFALCIMPLSLFAAVVVLTYGLLAWIALLAGIGLFGYLVARRYPPPIDPEPGTERERAGDVVRVLVRGLALDAAAIVAGIALLSIMVAAAAMVQQGHLSLVR